MDEREQRAEYLVRTYADTVARIGWTWFANPCDAQDICQNVLLKLLDDGRAFPDRTAERAFVLRVAVNECKNLKKSAWYRRTVGLEECMVAVPPPEDGGEVLEAVGALPAKYRQVVYLRYYEGYGVAEIGELLGIKPALVSTRLSRARAKLKDLLGGEPDGRAVSE